MTAESTGKPEALVTGASSGIGAATCRELRDNGWHVAWRSNPALDNGLSTHDGAFLCQHLKFGRPI